MCHNAGVGDRRQRHAGDQIHRAVYQRLLLGVRRVIVGDLIRQVFGFQKGQHFAVAGFRLFPKTDLQQILVKQVVFAQIAGGFGAKGGVNRTVAVFRKFEQLFGGGIFQQRTEQVHLALLQVADSAADSLVAVRAAVGHVFQPVYSEIFSR